MTVTVLYTVLVVVAVLKEVVVTVLNDVVVTVLAGRVTVVVTVLAGWVTVVVTVFAGWVILVVTVLAGAVTVVVTVRGEQYGKPGRKRHTACVSAPGGTKPGAGPVLVAPTSATFSVTGAAADAPWAGGESVEVRAIVAVP